MIIVSGCPRSGTSLMMDCLRHALGDSRIIGQEFPMERFQDKQKNETDSEYSARQYVLNRRNPTNDKRIQKAQDMNPNGFWECRYTVKGIQWHLNMPDLTGKVCKIVSQGLFHSDPQYIGKIIYMIRHPRQVAKSQEKIQHIPLSMKDGDDDITVHSPEMFIRVSYMASMWLLENNDVPFLMVNFDDLINDPDQTLQKVHDFIGEGDFSKHPVEKKLKRSNPQNYESHLWECAEEIYNLMQESKFVEVVQFFTKNVSVINRDNIQTYCTRLNNVMIYNECMNCKGKDNHILINNFKRMAENQGINWRNEPCMFDCLTSPNSEHLSMEESIKKNHWN